MEKDSTNLPARGSSGKNWIIGLLILVNLGLVGKIILDGREKQELEDRNELTETELIEAYHSIDSMQVEVEAKIAEISRLGGEIDTLLQVQAALEQEKGALQTRTRREIARLRNRLEGYTALLLQKDEEIIQLKEVNKELLSENTDLKDTQNKLESSLRDLDATRKVLQTKVDIASRLSIENVIVTGVNVRGNDMKKLRAKRVNLLRINFDIKPNAVAPADGKEIFIRIIDPNNRVLFDVQRGSGSFFYEEKELFYTLKQEILYNKKRLPVAFLYDKKSTYIPGTYRAELYTEGYLMGKNSFAMR